MGIGAAAGGKARRCYENVFADSMMGEEGYVPIDGAVLTAKTEPF